MASLRSGSHYGWRFSNLILSVPRRLTDSAPPRPPRGGAGDPVGPCPPGHVTVGSMKTRALRVTIHAYDDESWMVALVRDTFERGEMVQSDLLSVRWGRVDTIQALVAEAVQDLIEVECERLEIDPPPYPALGRVAPF